MTPEQRDKLIDNYAWRIVDGMDVKDLCRVMAEQIAANFEGYKNEEVIKEIKEFYPDLIEGADL
jgi:oligoribonuclease (3'-5' exoribonuclease)